MSNSWIRFDMTEPEDYECVSDIREWNVRAERNKMSADITDHSESLGEALPKEMAL